jgi:hypothetical protein
MQNKEGRFSRGPTCLMDASRLRLNACRKERVLEILRKRKETQKDINNTRGP